MVYGNFIGREKYQTTSTLDGGKFSGVPWVSGLIEGRGRMYDPKTGNSTDLDFIVHISVVLELRVFHSRNYRNDTTL